MIASQKQGTPRGIRNNNPGNIEYSKNNKWRGLDSPPVEPQGRFARFQKPEYGIRALCRLLITYQAKHKLKTVRQLINRWAPPSENSTGAYIQAVADSLGAQPDDAIDVTDYRVMKGMVIAIIKHENGMQPYSDDVISAGIAMANITVPPPKPLTQSRTIAGSTVAGTMVTATAVINETATQIEPLAMYSETIKTVFLVIALLGIGLAIYARITRDN
jgi:hypothetical protein